MSQMSCIEPMSKVISIIRKLGLQSTSKITKTHLVKRVLNFCYYLLLVTLILVNLVKAAKAGNEKTLNRMFCMLVPITNFIAKVVSTLLNSKYVSSIMNDLKSTAFNGHPEQLNDYIKLVYRISEILWQYYSITIGAFVLLAAGLPVIIDVDTMMIPVPFDMGRYEMVYKIMHLIATAFLALNSLCYDSFYMILMALCIAQLYILGDRLMNVFKEAELSRKSKDVETMGREEVQIIKECITLHEAINRFVDKLSVILSFPIFMQYIFGCFLICNAILRLTVLDETETANVISIVTWSGIIFFQLAVYHWLGNEITFKSAQLAEACYMSQWYMLNSRSQKLLLILMERARKPLVIKLYKLAFISLESLGTIMRWSYSLFALSKARYS